MGKYCLRVKDHIQMKGNVVTNERTLHQGRKETKKMPQDLDYESATQRCPCRQNNGMPEKDFKR